MKKNLWEIALIAPPWWLMPSEGTVTATEHLVEDYASNLRKRGYSSLIFARKADRTDEKGIQDVNGYNNEFRYIKLGFWDRYLLKAAAEIFYENYNYSIILYLFYILKIALLIRKLHIKQVMVFQTFTFCYWIRLINPNVKIIYHIGNHELSKTEKYFNYESISNRLAGKVFPKIDFVVTVSNYLKEGIAKRFPFERRKLRCIYPGIDTGIFSSKWNEKAELSRTIVYAGRIVPEKGVLVLAEAFQMLLKEVPDARLRIYSTSLESNNNESIMEQLKCNSIEICGILTRKRLGEEFRKAAVFVYPVICEEGLGLAPLEAMAAGLPVVVSKIDSGYREIINNNNGYFVECGDAYGLKEKLKQILQREKNQKVIGSNARKTIESKLSWNACIENIMKLFQEEILFPKGSAGVR